jgi:clan AA aspartic protease
MGMVYAEIELINSVDQGMARRYIIGEEEVRSTRVKMMVDTGSWMMAINESIQAYLNLPLVYKQTLRMANGEPITRDVVGPVEVRFGERRSTCNAFVLPGDSEPLLGAIPMEEMDLLIDPKRQQLILNPEYPYNGILRLGRSRPRDIS